MNRLIVGALVASCLSLFSASSDAKVDEPPSGSKQAEAPAQAKAGVSGTRRYQLLFGPDLDVIGALKMAPDVALVPPAGLPRIPTQVPIALGATIQHIGANEVQSVQFLLDGAPITCSAMSADYQATCTFSNSQTGLHTLAVRVTDTDGKPTESVTTNIELFNTVSLQVLAPTANQIFGMWPTAIELKVRATDPAGISRVEMFDMREGQTPAQATLIDTVTAPFPGTNDYRKSWTPTLIGKRTIIFRAFNNNAPSAMLEASVPIEVLAPITVTVSSPGSTYQLGQPIDLSATTSTRPGSSQIRFSDGDNALLTGTATSHTWTNASYGYHKARAEVVLGGVVLGRSNDLALSVKAQVDPASTALEPFQEYGKRVKAASMVGPLTSGLFGDQVSLYNGATEFRVTDIDVPGNDALPVSLSRRLKVEERRGLGFLGGFGDWDLDVAHMRTTVTKDRGWKVHTGAGAYSTDRCSNAVPPVESNIWFDQNEIWHGIHLHIPGEGDRELLKNTPDAKHTFASAAYPWVAKDFYRFRCLTSITNGNASDGSSSGQGFIAESPDGVSYTFGHAIERKTTTLRKAYIDASSIGLDGGSHARNEIFLMVTKVEDRFENWVVYEYGADDKLDTIRSSDGRSISLTWVNDKIQSASAHGRNWTYAYVGTTVGFPRGRLNTVTLPDTSSVWTYGSEGHLISQPFDGLPWEGEVLGCPEPPISVGGYTLTITHPSGGKGRFVFANQRHYRTAIPGQAPGTESDLRCVKPAGVVGYQYLSIPNYFDTWTLQSKAILDSQGITKANWIYDYGSVSANVPCEGPCAESKVVSVLQRVGGVLKKTEAHEFGVQYGKNEGRLLSQSTLKPGETSPLRKTSYSYLTDPQVAAAPFPADYGMTWLYDFDPLGAKIQPMQSVSIDQDGVTFTNTSTNFDALARAKTIERKSTLSGNPSRTEQIEYKDFNSPYVLGQRSSVRVDDTSVSPTKTYYPEQTTFCDSLTNPIADNCPNISMPRTYSVFGQLKRTFEWHTDGTLRSITDGNSKKTELSSYKRGVPQSIALPTGPNHSQQAEVDAWGNIDSVTDPLQNLTRYDQDSMGRIKKIDYPDSDSVAWNDTTIVYSKLTQQTYGLPIDSWMRTETTGLGVTQIYFDYLWRPVIERQFKYVDATQSQIASERFVCRQFDEENRVVFASYPASEWASCIVGVTNTYDALGRTTKVVADSELGALTTSTEYLSGFKTEVTNPRGYKTKVSYRSYDQPTYDRPVQIVAPEGATTYITRDFFDKPLTLKRSGLWNNEEISITRTYVYDDQQRLCKLIEPETGVTMFDYDLAGNLAWRAKAGSTTTTCDRPSALAGQRAIHSYDGMNRLLGINYPGTTTDVGYTYYADGAMHTATAGSAVWTYGYNKRRLLESESLSYDGRTFPLGHSYDVNGAVATRSYPSGLSVAFAPDALGRATQAKKVSEPVENFATDAAYHVSGQLSGFKYGNDILRQIDFNDRLLPTRIWDSGLLAGSALDHGSMAYDKNGNLIDLMDGRDGQESRMGMVYDGLDRLTSTGSGGNWGAEEFTYDPLDNARSMKLANINFTYEYSPSYHLTKISTDNGFGMQWDYAVNARGEITNRRATEGTSVKDVPLTFDEAGRLTAAVNVEQYAYDAHGRRVASITKPSGTKRYQVYDRAGELVHVEDQSEQNRIDYITLGGTSVARREQSLSGGAVTTVYTHSDARGTPTVETNSAQQVMRRNRLGPYGAPYDRVQSNLNGPGFTGHATDAATELTYMQQRYYDPVAMRFLSADPVDANTGSFSRYWYAANNPYKFTDPDGRNPRLALLFAKGFAEEAIVQYVTNGKVEPGQAATDAVTGMVNPTRTLQRVAKMAPEVAKAIKGIAGGGKKAPDFDSARREAFDNAGMTDPSKVEFSKVDPSTGTVVEFKGENGAKVGYDGPHASPGPHHDTQHISWQSGGKRGEGGAKRGNLPYSGEQHPSRPDRKDQK